MRPTSHIGGTLDPYAGRSGRQWWLVTCLLLMMTLGTIDRQIISLLINPAKADLGLTDTQISLIYGLAFAIAYCTFTLPAGYLADRTTRRWLVCAGAAVWSLMTMMLGAANTFTQLLLVRAGVGFGEGVIQPVSLSMLRDALPPERRGRGFALFAMGGMAGSALALILGAAIISAVQKAGIDRLPVFGAVHPWQVVLILLGLIGAPMALLMLTVKEPARPGGAAPDTEGVTFREAFAYVKRRWRIYLPLFSFQILFAMSALSFGAWIAPMIGRTFGLSIPQVGATLGVLMLFLPPGGIFVMGFLVDRVNKRWGLKGVSLLGAAAMILSTVLSVVAPLMPTLPAFWIAMVILLPLSGTPHPIGPTITAAITPARMMGKISSMQVFLNGILSAAVGPTLVALAADGLFTGNRALASALSLVVGVYGVLAVIAILLVARHIARNPSLVLKEA